MLTETNGQEGLTNKENNTLLKTCEGALPYPFVQRNIKTCDFKATCVAKSDPTHWNHRVGDSNRSQCQPTHNGLKRTCSREISNSHFLCYFQTIKCII